MANIEKFPLEARGETVSREALVQAALHEITQNYREASLSNVARSYGVSLAYVSECVRAQTGKTYKAPDGDRRPAAPPQRLEYPADHYLRRLREHQLLLPPFP